LKAEGLSAREIGVRLGVPMHMVQQIWYRWPGRIRLGATK
jgi:hypothetical protein